MSAPVAAAAPITIRHDTDRLVVWGLAAAVVVPLVVFVLVPLVAILRLSFVTTDGLGLANYAREFASPKFSKIVANSFSVSIVTTLITVTLAYGFAYAVKRTA